MQQHSNKTKNKNYKQQQPSQNMAQNEKVSLCIVFCIGTSPCYRKRKNRRKKNCCSTHSIELNWIKMEIIKKNEAKDMNVRRVQITPLYMGICRQLTPNIHFNRVPTGAPTMWMKFIVCDSSIYDLLDGFVCAQLHFHSSIDVLLFAFLFTYFTFT